MNTKDSCRRGDVLRAIEQNPGITKRQLMAICGIGVKAMEMHLARIAGERLAYSVPISGMRHAWHPGERPSAYRARITSVFDMAVAA